MLTWTNSHEHWFCINWAYSKTIQQKRLGKQLLMFLATDIHKHGGLKIELTGTLNW